MVTCGVRGRYALRRTPQKEAQARLLRELIRIGVIENVQALDELYHDVQTARLGLARIRRSSWKRSRATGVLKQNGSTSDLLFEGAIGAHAAIDCAHSAVPDQPGDLPARDQIVHPYRMGEGCGQTMDNTKEDRLCSDSPRGSPTIYAA